MGNKTNEEPKSYEYYEHELERVMSELEEGKIETLDKLIQNYEYGSTIIEKCEKILQEAEMRIQKISKRESMTNPIPSRNELHTKSSMPIVAMPDNTLNSEEK